MTKIEALGQVKDGTLKIMGERRFKEDLRQFKDCDVEIIIKKRGRRSSPQNRYYWAVVIRELQIRFRELGHDLDTDTVHEFLKGKFNSGKIVTPQAEEIEVGLTTTEMNKIEFSEYVDRIRAWAADTLEIWIPDPGQQTAIEY